MVVVVVVVVLGGLSLSLSTGPILYAVLEPRVVYKCTYYGYYYGLSGNEIPWGYMRFYWGVERNVSV